MLQFESHHTLSQAQGATGAHRPTPTGTSSNIAKKKQLVQVATFRFRLTDCTDKETSLFFFSFLFLELRVEGLDGLVAAFYSMSCRLELLRVAKADFWHWPPKSRRKSGYIQLINKE